MQYTTLKADDIDDLTEQIQEACAENWQPFGNLVAVPWVSRNGQQFLFIQPMVLLQQVSTPIRVEAQQERYPMCDDQPAQIDCRVADCVFNKGAGQCSNISPAITLNTTGKFVCWSRHMGKGE